MQVFPITIFSKYPFCNLKSLSLPFEQMCNSTNFSYHTKPNLFRRTTYFIVLHWENWYLLGTRSYPGSRKNTICPEEWLGLNREGLKHVRHCWISKIACPRQSIKHVLWIVKHHELSTFSISYNSLPSLSPHYETIYVIINISIPFVSESTLTKDIGKLYKITSFWIHSFIINTGWQKTLLPYQGSSLHIQCLRDQEYTHISIWAKLIPYLQHCLFTKLLPSLLAAPGAHLMAVSSSLIQFTNSAEN